jgi:TetR/AcrR family transcriptional regulator, mexJK operon transcriptional repressor
MVQANDAVMQPARRPGRPSLSNEALLDKALDLFLEMGFERTSIDAITAAAGMAKRTVYMRYEDKMALFKAALERAINEWIMPVERLRAAEVEDLETTLLRVGQILLSNVVSPAGLRLLRITNAESTRMPEIGAYTNEKGTAPTLAYLADLLRRRLGLGIAESEEAAQAFLYLVVGGPATATAWGVALDEISIDKHATYCVHLFLHGLIQPKQMPESLEAENAKLRALLVSALMDVAALKERLSGGG